MLASKLRLSLLPRSSARFALLLSLAGGTLQANAQFTAPSATLTFSPTSISFPAAPVGSVSAPVAVTVTNTGAVNANLVSYGFGGVNASDFLLGGNCSFPIAPGQSCIGTFSFAPSATGSRTASFQVTTDASTPTQIISLSGATGTQPLVFNPASITFSPTAVGSSATSQQVQVSNPNTSAVTLMSDGFAGPNPGDFVLTANNCNFPLPPNSSCMFAVAFAPSASGNRTASVEVNTSASQQTQMVQMTGTGGADTAMPTLSPAGGSFTTRPAVTLSSATSGAKIFYTTDGSTPTTNSRLYVTPLVVYTTETLRAMAMAGTSLSPVASATFSIDLGAGTTHTAAGAGSAGFSGDGQSATLAALNLPQGVALDASGNLYIADANNQRVRMVTPAGIISTVAGNGKQGFSGDGGPATSAALAYPNSVALDQSGNLYIADEYNNRIRKVTPAGIISTVAGTGSYDSYGDGGSATAAGVGYPAGVALDRAGNLYIADGNYRIRLVTPAGVISTVAGTGRGGFSGDGGPATAATINIPAGLAVDNAGNIYIVDEFNQVIREVSTTGIISTIAGSGSTGSAGDGGPAVSAQLTYPAGVVVDDAGNVYIADSGNHRIRRVGTDGTITGYAGNGVSGSGGDGGVPTAAQFTLPAGLALDANGNLFVADTNGQRIREIAH